MEALDCRKISQGAVVSAEEGPVEHEDRWNLKLRGRSITKISVDFRLVLILDSDWEVALEAPVSLSHGTVHASPPVLLTPESQDVAAALALFGGSVMSAVAFPECLACAQVVAAPRCHPHLTTRGEPRLDQGRGWSRQPRPRAAHGDRYRRPVC
ncbi:DUF6188 family protein [Streptomyces sp. NPDC056367]|uniref:DUF6188 family protein n=1 Tax=Streptomyces sp. NPDC056367 TaxID=3345797 RepID=UPI0035E2A058